MSKKATIIILALIIIGVYLYVSSGSQNQNETNQTGRSKELSSLVISAQRVIDKVVVDRVVLEKPGFVSVREVIDGKLGQILEVSKYLEVGEYKLLSIDLFDVPNEGVEPIVVVHEDNGDEGFNPAWDKMVLDNGEVVARYVETGKVVSTKIFTPSSGKNRDNININATIKYTDEGFVPSLTDISEGETVLFVNESSGTMWVASDPHPSHLILSTFDQFGTVPPLETYSYTFEEDGKWDFHDHINPSIVGTVIVN